MPISVRNADRKFLTSSLVVGTGLSAFHDADGRVEVRTTAKYAGLGGGDVPNVYPISEYNPALNGTTDDTAKWQQAIDECFTGGGGIVMWISSGVSIVKNLKLRTGVRLWLGDNSTLKLNPNAVPGDFLIGNESFTNGNSNMSITGGKYDGNTSAGQFTIGENITTFQFHRVVNMLISDCTVTGGIAEGIYFFESSKIHLNNVKASNNGIITVDDSDASGIHFDTCSHCTMSGVVANDNGFHGVYLNGSSWISGDMTTVNNHIDGVRLNAGYACDITVNSQSNQRGVYFNNGTYACSARGSMVENSLHGFVANLTYACTFAGLSVDNGIQDLYFLTDTAGNTFDGKANNIVDEGEDNRYSQLGGVGPHTHDLSTADITGSLPNSKLDDVPVSKLSATGTKDATTVLYGDNTFKTAPTAPVASSTVQGKVKTDVDQVDPIVYTKTTTDTLLATKAASSHTHTKSQITDFAHAHDLSTTEITGSLPNAKLDAVPVSKLSATGTKDATTYLAGDNTFKTTPTAPLASSTVSGKVKTDVNQADPIVYTKTTVDTLLAAKAASSHTHTKSQITDFAHAHDLSTTEITGSLPNAKLDAVPVSKLSATGTKDATTVLYGDNTFKTAPTAPLASTTVSGKVKTDVNEADPVVYTKATTDTLLATKAASSHTHTKSQITDFAHTHDLSTAEITGSLPNTKLDAVPVSKLSATGTKDATTVLYGDNTFKGASSHTHTKSQITDFAHVHSGADITTGTVADARLSANMAKYNGTTAFTGSVFGSGHGAFLGTTSGTTGSIRIANGAGLGWFLTVSDGDGTLYFSDDTESVLLALTLDGVLAGLTGVDVANISGSTFKMDGVEWLSNATKIIGGGVTIPFASVNGQAAYAQLPNAGGTWNAGGGTVALTGSLTASINLKTGSITKGWTSKTAAYTLTNTDHVCDVTATSGAVIITLPTAVGNAGREYRVTKVDASANTVTVNTTSSQTINGAATKVLSAQWASTLLYSNGTNWVAV